MARDKASILKNAQKFAARGQIDKALGEWQKLLDENPSDGNTHNIVGDLHLKKNDKTSAVASFVKAADLFKSAGFSLKAMALYKKILNIDPGKVDALLSLAALNAERGLAGNANENYINAADLFLKSGNTEAALGIYEKMVELSPSNAMIRAKVADLYIKMGLREKACKEYLACADMLLNEGKLEKAETAFRRVREMRPNHPHAYLGLSRVLESLGRGQEAREELRKAQEAVAGDPQMEYLYAKAASEAGMAHEALGAIEGLLRGEPNHAAACRLKAELLLKEGRGPEAWEQLFPVTEDLARDEHLGDAISILEPFTEDDGYRKDALLRLGTLYRNAGEKEKAGITFKKLGAAFEESGQVREARRSYTEASELLPEDEILKEKVAAYSSAEPEDVVVETTQKEAVAESTEVSLSTEEDITFEMAEEPAEVEKTIEEALLEVEVFARYKQFDQALVSLEAARLRDPDNPEIYVWLQRVYAEQGNQEAMLGACEEAVRLLRNAGDEERAREMVREAETHAPEDERLSALMVVIGETVTGSEPGAAAEVITPFDERDEPEVGGFGVVREEETSAWATDENAGTTGSLSEEEIGEPDVAHEPGADAEATWGGGWAGETVDDSWLSGGDETPAFDGSSTESDEPMVSAEHSTDEPEMGSFGTVNEIDFGLEDQSDADEITPDLGDAGEVPFGEASEGISEDDLGEEEVRGLPEFDLGEDDGGIFDEDIVGEPLETESGARLADYDDDLAEAEFYAQQGLKEEAKKIFERLVELLPGDEQLQEKIVSLGLTDSGIAQPGTAGQETGETFEDAGAMEIAEALEVPGDYEQGMTAHPVEHLDAEEAVEAVETEEFVAPEGESGLDEEPGMLDDVFGTLDLDEEDEPLVAGEEEGDFETLDLFDDEEDAFKERAEGELDTDRELAEIFNAFKQGVEKELEEGDFETHYNLGIAYKEMGLIDDAIREFQIVNKSPDLSVDGASMLGICYMEKGLPELAVEQYRKALDLVSAEPDAADSGSSVKALKFDLANALEGAGNAAEARKLFVEVYAEDAKFRDVSARVEALKKDADTSSPSAPKRDRVSYI